MCFRLAGLTSLFTVYPYEFYSILINYQFYTLQSTDSSSLIPPKLAEAPLHHDHSELSEVPCRVRTALEARCV